MINRGRGRTTHNLGTVAVPARAGGMREAGSALEMWRLEAPVRDKPGIDQHQRRALRTDLRDIGRDIFKKAKRHRAVMRYEAPV